LGLQSTARKIRKASKRRKDPAAAMDPQKRGGQATSPCPICVRYADEPRPGRRTVGVSSET
jgi:hypothetical protein